MKTNVASRSAAIRLALALVICALAAGQAGADPLTEKPARRGLFLGANLGFGASGAEYKDSSRTITEDPIPGGFGGMRIGYAFSPKLALSFEGFGFGASRERDNDGKVSASVLAVTWHPGGKGFFVRAGFGEGCADFTPVDATEQLSVEEQTAWLFGVGYEWQLGEHTSLGLAADGISVDAGGVTGFDNDSVSAGGFTLQFNWYL
jgi:hypothetical protein